MKLTALAIVGALVAISLAATAAVMFTTGNQALERLGILVAVFASIIPGLISALRADAAAVSSAQAAESTNGSLEARMRRAVQDAVGARRATDRVVVTRATDPTRDTSAVELPRELVDPLHTEG